MTYPRCGAIIDGFPCPQCGFPETAMRMVFVDGKIKAEKTGCSLRRRNEKLYADDL